MQNRNRPLLAKGNAKADNFFLRIQEINTDGKNMVNGNALPLFSLNALIKTEHFHEMDRRCNNIITLREKEVLQMLGNGDSSKIIAEKLHISLTTAITHRKNLIRKLHVKNTAHLIKTAVLSGIIY